MARSSKKTIKRLDYKDYNTERNEYQEEVVKSLIGSGNGMFNITKKMTRRKAKLVLSCVGTFYLGDGDISVSVSPLLYDYNSRLHSAVYKLDIDAQFKNGAGYTTSKYGSTWSSENPETVFEAADSLIEDVTVTAWNHYNRCLESLDKK